MPSWRNWWLRSIAWFLNCFWHTSHVNGVSVVCESKWLRRPCARTNDLPHKSHTNRATFKCTFLCSVNDVWYLYCLLHCVHWNCLMSSCLRRCRRNARRLLNSFAQIEHTSGFWPACIRWWAAKRSALRNDCEHSLHQNVDFDFVVAIGFAVVDVGSLPSWFVVMSVATFSSCTASLHSSSALDALGGGSSSSPNFDSITSISRLILADEVASASINAKRWSFESDCTAASFNLLPKWLRSVCSDCSHCCLNDCQAQHLYTQPSHMLDGRLSLSPSPIWSYSCKQIKSMNIMWEDIYTTLLSNIDYVLRVVCTARRVHAHRSMDATNPFDRTGTHGKSHWFQTFSMQKYHQHMSNYFCFFKWIKILILRCTSNGNVDE